jgi:hypothetical protein
MVSPTGYVLSRGLSLAILSYIYLTYAAECKIHLYVYVLVLLTVLVQYRTSMFCSLYFLYVYILVILTVLVQVQDLHVLLPLLTCASQSRMK